MYREVNDGMTREQLGATGMLNANTGSLLA